MLQKIGLTLVVLASVAAVFFAGMFAQRQYQLAQVRARVAFARDLVGLDDPVSSPPTWESWLAPQAKVQRSVVTSAVWIENELVRPAGQYAVLTTPLGFEEVVQFYAEAAHFDSPREVATSAGASQTQGTLQGEEISLLDDVLSPASPPVPRPVRCKCLIQRCPAFALTVFVSRADDEEHTHVVLLYVPAAAASAGP